MSGYFFFLSGQIVFSSPMINNNLGDDETVWDFSSFMEISSEEQEQCCYEAFYDATLNEALQFHVCPVCT